MSNTYTPAEAGITSQGEPELSLGGLYGLSLAAILLAIAAILLFFLT